MDSFISDLLQFGVEKTFTELYTVSSTRYLEYITDVISESFDAYSLYQDTKSKLNLSTSEISDVNNILKSHIDITMSKIFNITDSLSFTYSGLKRDLIELFETESNPNYNNIKKVIQIYDITDSDLIRKM